MPGMDHSCDPMPDMDHSGTAELQQLSPLEFETLLVDDDAFVVNVHVPAGDSLDGTDETIAFDEIVGSDRLPDANYRDRKRTRMNSSHSCPSRMPSSA